ncbi:MAG TPA: hypothetical protein VJ779_22425, partial [Acetobacteraceae bacterium]|nr:hypothetical protein [Acetobacteraceae bacterium]
MPINNEPGAAVQEILEQLIDRIKSARPIRSDKRPAELGFVYSQLVLGMMVDPDDYNGAWTPAGGASVQDLIHKGALPAKPAAAPATPGADGAAAPAPEPDRRFQRAMNAAFNTSMLVDRLIMVTKDNTYLEYPGGGRKISAAYAGIINGMQPGAPSTPAPDVQKRIDEARKVLYVPDDDGDLVIKSKLYKAYEKNTKAYGQAVADYAAAEAEATTDRAKADAWPVTSKPLRQAVDAAWDTLKSEGAEKVEAALDVLESVGVDMDARLIAKARKDFDRWNLGLAGVVPVDVPYAYCSPSSWADPDEDHDGWETLEVYSNKCTRHMGKDSAFFSSFKRDTHSSSTSVSGGGCYMGFGASGGYHTADAHEKDDAQTSRKVEGVFKNTAKNLHIKLQYGIVEVMRPWLLGDLFRLKNWYLVNNKKGMISDGTIDGQAESQDSLLPMIPMQFLVVRNVSISSKEWGEDGHTLKQMFGEEGGAWDKSSSGFHAGASYGFGPFSVNANVSHDQAKEGVSRYGKHTSSERKDYEATFDGSTLTI